MLLCIVWIKARNYEMHMETLRYYMEMVSDRLEVLMIPRLISNLEEATKSQVIWINDAVNIENYKHIQKVLFLGLHPLNKMPYLLNYAASPENMELNFEITTVWTHIRDWIYKERVSLDLNSLNDKVTGNYIFQFNKNSELVYLNDFDKQELDPFFQFPATAKSKDDLLLSKILKHRILHDTLQSIILGLLESGDRESSISKPNINIRVQVNDKGRLKGYSLIFRSSTILNYKLKDPYADFEYAVTPLALLKHDDGIDNASNIERGGDSNSVSASSAAKAYSKDNHLHKRSHFGQQSTGRQGLLDPKRTPSPDELAPKGPPQRRLQKQSSRFTIEGSLFSEGGKSIQLPIPAHHKKKNKGFASCRQDIDDCSETMYKQIEQKVNKSIVMEYMQGLSGPAEVRGGLRKLASDRSLGKQNEISDPDEMGESCESFVKVLLEEKRKKYQGVYEHNKIKPTVEAIESVKLNFELDDWNFNALDQSVTYLMATVNNIYERLEFFKEFNIQKDTFVSFLWQCHYYYTRNNNPFHNFFHGVTVCHAGYYFLVSSPILSSMMTPQVKLAFVTACLGHDLDHRGRNNLFEINSKSKLAIRYFDKSPLENHHAAVLFTILKESESDIFRTISDEKLKDIKLNIIENILATDMKLHFPMLAEFKKKIAESPDIMTPVDVLESTKVFTHCADLAGSCKEFSIASRWSYFVNKEFIEQYEEEKRLGIPESAHFKNLTDPQGYLNSEIGFIDVILNPLYEAANEFLKRRLEQVMGNIRGTRETYAARLEAIKQNPDSPYAIGGPGKQDSTNYIPVSVTPRVMVHEPKD